MKQFDLVGTFCDKCRNATCICKENLQVEDEEFEDDEDDDKDWSSHGLCKYCNHYHNLDNECTDEFEY